MTTHSATRWKLAVSLILKFASSPWVEKGAVLWNLVGVDAYDEPGYCMVPGRLVQELWQSSQDTQPKAVRRLLGQYGVGCGQIEDFLTTALSETSNERAGSPFLTALEVVEQTGWLSTSRGGVSAEVVPEDDVVAWILLSP
jgi:hypothetical protein